MKVSELIIKLTEIAALTRWDVEVNFEVDEDTVKGISLVKYDDTYGGDGIVLN